METNPSVNPEPANDIEVAKKMEDESLRLQRQVRMIQVDRMNRIVGVHPQFRRQDRLLKTLKKEYTNLVMDLNIARSGAHKKKDKKMKSDLKNALLFRNKTMFECQAGNNLMEELEGLIRNNTKSMLRLRNVVNANKGQIEERRSQSKRRLISTENQLETAMLKFNQVQCENKKIREGIEHVLKDRMIFNQAWSKMLNALCKGKKFLTDLFESSNVAYDQRDEWCRKLRSMQEKGKMDQMLQVQEMRDLQKALDHEMKLYNFLAKKGVMRINKLQEEREQKQKQKEAEDFKKDLEAHFSILNDIHNYTQEESIEKIIFDFENREQHNFAIYKMLTDLCAENEMLDKDLKKIRQDLGDRRDWNEMMEGRRTTKIEKLKQELEEQKEKVEELRRTKLQEQTLNGTMEKIIEIFNMLDCSLEPFQNLLGDKQPSLWRMNLTFTMITDKIKEYIEMVYYYERCLHKKDKSTTSRLKKYTIHSEPPVHWTSLPINCFVTSDPCPTCIEARWLSRVCEVPEVPFDRAMSLEALRQLSSDPSYCRGDRLHALADCRLPRSRLILARRYM